MKYRAIGSAVILSCAGCSSIIEGTSQEIEVATYPSGASCTLLRQGQPIGQISQTPGSTLIKKTKYDITVLCDKPGYVEATTLDPSGTAMASVANLLSSAGIGWVIDSAAGADNEYDSPVNLTLALAPQAVVAPAPVASVAAPAAVAVARVAAVPPPAAVPPVAAEPAAPAVIAAAPEAAPAAAMPTGFLVAPPGTPEATTARATPSP